MEEQGTHEHIEKEVYVEQKKQSTLEPQRGSSEYVATVAMEDVIVVK